MNNYFVSRAGTQRTGCVCKHPGTSRIAVGLLLTIAGLNTTLLAEDPASPVAAPAPLTEREQYFLKEIQVLKAKLVELESQLTGGPDSSGVAIVPASLQGPKKDAVAASLAPPEAAPAADAAAAPEKKEKPAPFAFGDFT